MLTNASLIHRSSEKRDNTKKPRKIQSLHQLNTKRPATSCNQNPCDSDASKRLTEAKNTFQYSNEQGQNQGLKMEDSGMYSSERKGSG